MGSCNSYHCQEAHKSKDAEIARLNDECTQSMDTIARERARAENAEAKNERLRRFLSIAIDAHDDDHGEVNPEVRPKHWTVQARKLIATIPARDEGEKG